MAGINSDTLTAIENLTGGQAGDRLTGNGSANIIRGGLGNDLIYAGGGVDQSFGDAGLDRFTLNTGQIVAGEIINGGADSDRLEFGTSTSLAGANVLSIESLRLTGAGTIQATLQANQIGAGKFAATGLIYGRAGLSDRVLVDLGAVTSADLSAWTFAAFNTSAPELDRIIILGDGDNEFLKGSTQSDAIYGNGGSDRIFGRQGSDVLITGLGNDAIYFDTALGTTNVDKITDYAVGADEMRLENAIFVGLAAGNLAAAAFRTGAAAADATDRIIYNAATGSLFFDADGLGGAAQTRFAILSAGLALGLADFFVI